MVRKVGFRGAKGNSEHIRLTASAFPPAHAAAAQLHPLSRAQAISVSADDPGVGCVWPDHDRRHSQEVSHGSPGNLAVGLSGNLTRGAAFAADVFVHCRGTWPGRYWPKRLVVDPGWSDQLPRHDYGDCRRA